MDWGGWEEGKNAAHVRAEASTQYLARQSSPLCVILLGYCDAM